MTFAFFCRNCGTAQAPGSEFCVVCGFAQKMDVADPQAAPIAGPAAAVTQVPPPSQSEPLPPAGPPSAATLATTPAPATASGRASAPAFSFLQLIGAVVGVSVAVGALAVAITLILSRGHATPPIGGGSTNAALKVVEVDNIRVEIPNAWDVVTRARDTIVVDDPASRALWLRSAALPAALTLDEIQARFIDRSRDQSPDARICAGPDTAALPGGPRDGRYFVVCSTFVPQGGGPAVRLADAYYIGLWGGATVSVLQLTAVPGELEAFATDVQALPPPVWKLHH